MGDNQKNYKTEWSFSFEKLGDDMREFFKDIGTNAEEEIKSGAFEADIAGGTAARVRIDLSVGETTIKALETEGKLIEANLIYVGDIRFSAETNDEGVRVVSLSQSAGAKQWFRGALGWIGSKRQLRWDVGLSAALPMDLDIRGGVGESVIDLRGLNLTKLHVSGGAGEMKLLIPAGKYETSLDCGVGEIKLTVQAGAEVDLTIGGGVGELNVIVEPGATIATKIRGGVGEVDVQVPESTPTSVTVKSGIGGVNVPSRFVRLSGAGSGFDRSGTWQTPGFEGAVAETRPIIIHYDGGVGSLNIR
ncbi:MAG: hypothetical protein U0670_18765 [Anaerolineae bacterium]